MCSHDHTDDGTGRCRRCPLGNQAGFQRWPCRLHQLAKAAIDVRTVP